MIPLAVVITTSRTCRVITKDLRSLQFRSTVPGGFGPATFSLHRPLRLSPDELSYYAKVEIVDTRSGLVVNEGRLEDPGRGAGSDGEIWDVATVGNSAHASDRKRARIYVDQSTERWRRHSSTLRNASTNAESDDDDTASLVMTMNNGAAVGSGQGATMFYRALAESGQKLARVRAFVSDGGTSSLWDDILLTQNSDVGGAATTVTSSQWSNTGRYLYAERGGTPAVPSGHDIVFYRSARNASGTATDGSWSKFGQVIVRAMLTTKAGTDITSGYSNNYVLAHEVVSDLLGSLLPKYDGANASVATNTFAIDQLAYPDGATPAEILDDLMLMEPGYYWAAWESRNTPTGKIVFEWKAWPTSVRYEATVNDGFDSPGSANGLFNRVNVRWRSPQGNIRLRSGSQTVTELDDASLIREETVDLGDNIGSSSIGDQTVTQFLAEHRYPPNAGTLTVARPIMDLAQGWKVQPWEIRPGELIRVRGVLPNADVLNSTVRDGVSVFRVVGVEYDSTSASAKLELDAFPYTTARAIAKLRSQMWGLYKIRRR